MRKSLLASLLFFAGCFLAAAQNTFPVVTSESVTIPNNTYEEPLTFNAPLSRSGAVVSCPTCGGSVKQFSSTAPVTVTGVTAATTLLGAGAGSLTLPANFFASPGDVIRVVYQGLMDPNGVSGGADTYLLKFNGATVFIGQANAVPPSTAGTNACSMVLYLTARTVGTSATLIGQGHLICGFPGTSSAVFDTPVKMNSTFSFDSTAAQTVDFQVQPGSTAHVNTQSNFILANF